MQDQMICGVQAHVPVGRLETLVTKSPAQLDREIATALARGPELPATLKKTYVQVRVRNVSGPRGAPAGFEATLVEPGATTLFRLFGLAELTPGGMVDYGKAMREHGNTWAAWDARSGTVRGTIRPRRHQGGYISRDETEAAAIDLARRRGYVIVDGDLVRAGLPLDDNA
jgi:hypothetical protein